MAKRLVALFFTLLYATHSWAVVDDGLLYDKLTDPRFCNSADEFKSSYQFLIKQEELSFTEPQAVRNAIKIAKNCTGAFDRFSQVFRVMQRSGVDIKKTFDVALEYSGYNTERAKNFYVLFQKLFLDNYLDLDFTTAYKLTHELSREYKGDPVKLRDDFVNVVNYCTNDKNFSLGKALCLDLAQNLTKYTELFPNGVFGDFKSFVTYVQNNKILGFNLKETLKLSVRVISRGPKGARNFKQTIDFALDKSETLKLPEFQAFQLALIISDMSFDPSKKMDEKTEDDKKKTK